MYVGRTILSIAIEEVARSNEVPVLNWTFIVQEYPSVILIEFNLVMFNSVKKHLNAIWRFELASRSFLVVFQEFI